MIEKIKILYNTMQKIETKGESTRIMAQCLAFTEQLISEGQEKQPKENKEATGE